MTDNEIIRVLNHIVGLYAKDLTTICGIRLVTLCGDVLDLINRQKAEIERLEIALKNEEAQSTVFFRQTKELQAEIERLNLENLQMVASIKNLKAEAIKEFMAKAKCFGYYIDYPKEHRVIDEDDLDNLAKEMEELWKVIEQ